MDATAVRDSRSPSPALLPFLVGRVRGPTKIDNIKKLVPTYSHLSSYWRTQVSLVRNRRDRWVLHRFSWVDGRKQVAGFLKKRMTARRRVDCFESHASRGRRVQGAVAGARRPELAGGAALEPCPAGGRWRAGWVGSRGRGPRGGWQGGWFKVSKGGQNAGIEVPHLAHPFVRLEVVCYALVAVLWFLGLGVPNNLMRLSQSPKPQPERRSDALKPKA